MVDMGYTEDEKKNEFGKQKSLIDDTPEYPYGLRISLRPEDTAKLGCKECEVGEVKEFVIKVKVVSKNIEDQYSGMEAYPSLGLQITEMEPIGEKDKKSDADKMYGE